RQCSVRRRFDRLGRFENERRILRKNISDGNYNFLDELELIAQGWRNSKCEFRTILATLVFVTERPVVISVKSEIRRNVRIIARRYNTSLDLSRPVKFET
ncbi:hypothetical protein PIB30_105509, partial [Stylosanthes scabra]|nr:hypothetical protein [Stylosanthes scabra]